MKKFKSIFGIFLIAALAICSEAQAQQTTPRFGVGVNFFGGNNGVKYTPSFSLNNTNDVAGLDTVKLFGNVFVQNVAPADSVRDSLVYCFKSIASCYPYDQLTFNFIGSNKAGLKIKFRNKYTSAFVFTTAADSTLAIAAKKRTRITFVFDGTKWIETGKVVQP